MTPAALPGLDTRVRLDFLTSEHDEHRLTVNIYVGNVGATDARVWCATCDRTLRARGRAPRAGEEVVIGLG